MKVCTGRFSQEYVKFTCNIYHMLRGFFGPGPESVDPYASLAMGYHKSTKFAAANDDYTLASLGDIAFQEYTCSLLNG
jgi:hypothetical protein